MPAFRNAALEERAVVELDVRLTKDGVPVVIHDDTPDRTTTCDAPTGQDPDVVNRAGRALRRRAEDAAG
jgi:glycerophosphoryl diester phosphodiesterase